MYGIGQAINEAVSMMMFVAALFGAAFVGAIWAVIYVCQHIYWEWI